MSDHEHIRKLFDEAREVRYDSKDYWRLRALYLEKYIDPTYSQDERGNCFRLFDFIKNRTK